MTLFYSLTTKLEFQFRRKFYYSHTGTTSRLTQLFVKRSMPENLLIKYHTCTHVPLLTFLITFTTFVFSNYLHGLAVLIITASLLLAKIRLDHHQSQNRHQ